MFIHGKHISTYYSEIKKLESIVFNYDLEVLEGLIKFIRGNRLKLKEYCIKLAISNPPLSEENKGYPYPEGIDPIEYWLQNQSFQFEEYDYYEALISKVFDTKIPDYMKPGDDYQEVKTRESLKVDTHFDFKALFVSDDHFQKFIKGLISLGIIDEITQKVKHDAQYSDIGGILKLLHSKEFIVRKLTNAEIEKAAKIVGCSGKMDTLRKGKFDNTLFNKHFYK